MNNSVYIATSLDGYIATLDGGIEWLNDIPDGDESDYGWSAFIESIDAIVMGRVTFEKILSFEAWPYAHPVVVLSSSMTHPPEHLRARVEVLAGDPSEIVPALHARGWRKLYVDGGRTIQRFLAEDAVDELIITRVPVLLGGGVPLFGSLAAPLHFRHAGTKVFNDTLVQSTYVRDR